MLRVVRVPRSSGKNRRMCFKPVFAYTNDLPIAPTVSDRKDNQPVSRRLLKKRGLYDPVKPKDNAWTTIR